MLGPRLTEMFPGPFYFRPLVKPPTVSRRHPSRSVSETFEPPTKNRPTMPVLSVLQVMPDVLYLHFHLPVTSVRLAKRRHWNRGQISHFCRIWRVVTDDVGHRRHCDEGYAAEDIIALVIRSLRGVADGVAGTRAG